MLFQLVVPPAVLVWGLDRGYPILLMGRVPILFMGVPHPADGGVPHPAWGYPGYPCPDLGWGNQPKLARWGSPYRYEQTDAWETLPSPFLWSAGGNYKYMDWKVLAAILATKRLAGVSPEVISGIHCMQVTKHTSEGFTLSLKPRTDITRSSKRGYQWPHKKDFEVL